MESSRAIAYDQAFAAHHTRGGTTQVAGALQGAVDVDWRDAVLVPSVLPDPPLWYQEYHTLR